MPVGVGTQIDAHAEQDTRDPRPHGRGQDDGVAQGPVAQEEDVDPGPARSLGRGPQRTRVALVQEQSPHGVAHYVGLELLTSGRPALQWAAARPLRRVAANFGAIHSEVQGNPPGRGHYG